MVLQLLDLFACKLKQSVEKILQYKEELGLQEIWLFGSVARNEYSMDSDLDLMLITDKDTKKIRILVEKYDLEDEETKPYVDVTVKQREMLKDKDYAFNEIVEKDKVVLWKRQ